MIRNGTANWKGGLKGGGGTVSTDSGVLSNVAYSFSKRFENEPGTNPEELVAAAYAGCYAMALAAGLEKSGKTVDNVDAKASVTLEKVGDGFGVTKIHLDVVATVPDITPAEFSEAAAATKAGCPIGKLLTPGTDVSLEAKLA